MYTINETKFEFHIFLNVKFTYTAGTGNSKRNCINDALKCSDFLLDLINIYYGITLSDSSKKMFIPIIHAQFLTKLV